MVRLVTTEAEFRETINTNEFVVVNFFTEQCSAYRTIAPMIEDLDNATHNVIFIKVNTEQLANLAEEFDVTDTPTFRFFKNGQSGYNDVVVGADIGKITGKLATFIA
ncbi:thioredoxin-like protein [Syncephalis fuscata]|nr:thioredoxin-like protein [Syncephalis fuscata]